MDRPDLPNWAALCINHVRRANDHVGIELPCSGEQAFEAVPGNRITNGRNIDVPGPALAQTEVPGLVETWRMIHHTARGAELALKQLQSSIR
jgi:hypothetical protein